VQVSADDPTPPSANIKQAHGMVAEPYEDIFADLKVSGQGGTFSVDVELLIWSDQSQRFLPFSTAVKFTAITGPKMMKFNVGGARFFLRLSGTWDSGKVDIQCSGINPVLVQSA